MSVLLYDTVLYNGKKCILSTALFEDDDRPGREYYGKRQYYECMLMYKNGYEIDSYTTKNRKDAIKLHLASAEKLRDRKERGDGVAVGMLFYASWGYEQTNTTFFQIVELVGKKSVRVRCVRPEVLDETAVSGMSAYYTYKNDRKILEPVESTFIENDAAGDIKRIKNDGGRIRFDVSSYARAYQYDGRRLYESWYA